MAKECAGSNARQRSTNHIPTSDATAIIVRQKEKPGMKVWLSVATLKYFVTELRKLFVMIKEL